MQSTPQLTACRALGSVNPLSHSNTLGNGAGHMTINTAANPKLWHHLSVTFNNNLGDYSDRGSSAGGGGGFGGGGGRGGGGPLMWILGSVIGRRFGIPGILILGAVLFFMNGGMGMFGGGGNGGQQAGHHGESKDFSHCKTADDANKHDDCRMLATATSLDKFWGQAVSSEIGKNYSKPGLKLGEGNIRSGCGNANLSQSGPFYCPKDETVYMSTKFFDELKKLGGSNAPFSQEYVVAHEFGHHIQNIQGTLGLSDYNDPGADSNAVKMEVQADCYAGVWAQNADKGKDALLEPITQQQVDEAIRTVQSIGDDHIQKNSGGGVNPDKWTHGSSKQRLEWFMRGYQGGTVDSCKQSFNR